MFTLMVLKSVMEVLLDCIGFHTSQ